MIRPVATLYQITMPDGSTIEKRSFRIHQPVAFAVTFTWHGMPFAFVYATRQDRQRAIDAPEYIGMLFETNVTAKAASLADATRIKEEGSR